MLLVSVGGLLAVECAGEILPVCDPCRKSSDQGLGAIDSPAVADVRKPSGPLSDDGEAAGSVMPTREQAVFIAPPATLAACRTRPSRQASPRRRRASRYRKRDARGP